MDNPPADNQNTNSPSTINQPQNSDQSEPQIINANTPQNPQATPLPASTPPVNQQNTPQQVIGVPQNQLQQTNLDHAAVDNHVKPPRNYKKIFLFFIGFFIPTVLLAVFALVMFVAYEKIDLAQYPQLQRRVGNLVMSMPFMPKTPKFLLAKTLLAHEKVTKHSYDISLALQSDDISEIIGMNRFDFQIKGDIDYTDPKNIIFNADMSLTKDFNMQAKSKDEILYFKINKIPSLLLSAVGIPPGSFDPLTNVWVAYDTTPLETQASQKLQDREQKTLSYDFLDDLFDNYIDEQILDKIKIQKVIYNNEDYYKLTLEMNSDTIDYLEKKLSKEKATSLYTTNSTPQIKASDIIKSLNWEILIDQKNFYTHKMVIDSTLEFDQSYYPGDLSLGLPQNTTGDTKLEVAFAMLFEDFGKEVVVEKPDSFISFEEFTNQISQIVQGIYASMIPQATQSVSIQQTNDMLVISDLTKIQAALELYKAENYIYPMTLEELSPLYIMEIPKQPDESDFFYLRSADGTNYDLCGILVTEDGNATCPDRSYNYHLTAP